MRQFELAVKETEALGERDVRFATTLYNLGMLYHVQGPLSGSAEPLSRRSLTIPKMALRPEHRHVATNLNNLAELYRTQGQYAQAEPLLKRRRQSYTENVHDGGSSLENFLGNAITETPT